MAVIMSDEEIVKKARELGIDPTIDGYGVKTIDGTDLNGSYVQNIASQLGMDPSHFNKNDLATKLMEMSSQNDNVEYLDSTPNELGEYGEQSHFGEKEYNRAKDKDGKYDKNYYANREKELDKKVKNAKEEKANDYKSDTKQKNVLDRVKDNYNVAKARQDRFQNKIDNVKSKAYQMMHPGEALKDKAKSTVKSGVKNLGKKTAKAVYKGTKNLVKLLISNPMLAVGLLFMTLFIFILFISIFFFNGIQTAHASDGGSYYDSTCNYNETSIIFSTCSSNESSALSIKDYVIGSTYAYIKEQNYNNETIKALMIVLKTNALSIGGYNNSSKTININDCNVSYESIQNISSNIYSNLDKLYSEIENYLYLFESYNSTISNLSSADALPFDENTIDTLNSYSGNYKTLLDNMYGNGENITLYDMGNYCTYYNVTENDEYWWPIGSSSPTKGDIYGGTPRVIGVNSEFQPSRTINGVTSSHKGIDIRGSYNSDVVIASREGTVIKVNDSCPSDGFYGNSCGTGYGNYVFIDHGNGIVTRYAHMYLGSIVVKVGDHVEQGQKIGMVGSSGSSTGAHLHFEIVINGIQINPREYIDEENPRPGSYQDLVVNPNSTKNYVCRTLLNSGFTKNGTIGIMVNIAQESSFNPNEGGDKGTSYGLFQWHNSRWTDLKNYRPNSWQTKEGQLEFFFYELSGFSELKKKLTGNNYTGSELALEFCKKFERPAGSCQNRVDKHLSSITQYVNNGCS